MLVVGMVSSSIIGLIKSFSVNYWMFVVVSNRLLVHSVHFSLLPHLSIFFSWNSLKHRPAYAHLLLSTFSALNGSVQKIVSLAPQL